MTEPAEVAAAWEKFCGELRAFGEELCALAPVQDATHHAEALQFVTRTLRAGLDFRLDNYDPRHPRLIWWDRACAGAAPSAPNVDNSYVIAKIDGRETYRLTVPLDTIDELNLSIHGRYYGQPDSGPAGVWGNVTLHELKHNGREVQVILSAKPQDRENWLEIGEEARFLFLRLYYFDWSKGRPPALELTCLSANEPAPNSIPPENLIGGLADTMAWLRSHILYEQQMAIGSFLKRSKGERNAYYAADYGGVAPPAYRYGNVEFELGPDEALVMEFKPPNARYWCVQWHRMPWGDSADFFNHITSINHRQGHVDSDGLVRIVVSAKDPGVQNWIDTEGRRTGLMFTRWFWADAPAVPTCQVVSLSDVRSLLPGDTPNFGSQARAEQMAVRRRHLQLRY